MHKYFAHMQHSVPLPFPPIFPLFGNNFQLTIIQTVAGFGGVKYGGLETDFDISQIEM